MCIYLQICLYCLLDILTCFVWLCCVCVSSLVSMFVFIILLYCLWVRYFSLVASIAYGGPVDDDQVMLR